MKPRSITSYTNHPIWKSEEAQSLVANATLFLAGGLHKFNVLDFYRNLARFAKERYEITKYLDELAEADKKKGKNKGRTYENFRRFLRRETNYMQDACFLDCWAQFIFFEIDGVYGAHKDRSKNWERYLTHTLGISELERDFRLFLDSKLESDQNFTQKYSPKDDILRISKAYFGVDKSDFSEVALSLTGNEQVPGKADWPQRGYWSCYRLSGMKPEFVVKTRLIITPPDEEYPYCRFLNITKKDNHGVRDSHGVVIPLKQNIYFIGSFPDTKGKGAKIMHLKSINHGSHVSHGLIMTVTMRDDDVIVSRLFANRERADEVVSTNSDGTYEFKRDDLGEFDIQNGFDQMVKNYEYEDRNFEDIVQDLKSGIQNFPENIFENIDEESKKIIGTAITSLK